MKIKSITKENDIYHIYFQPTWIERMTGFVEGIKRYKIESCKMISVITGKTTVDYCLLCEDGEVIMSGRIYEAIRKYQIKQLFP